MSKFRLPSHYCPFYPLLFLKVIKQSLKFLPTMYSNALHIILKRHKDLKIIREVNERDIFVQILLKI